MMSGTESFNENAAPSVPPMADSTAIYTPPVVPTSFEPFPQPQHAAYQPDSTVTGGSSATPVTEPVPVPSPLPTPLPVNFPAPVPITVPAPVVTQPSAANNNGTPERNSEDVSRRRPGRPRKYGPAAEVSSAPLALASPPPLLLPATLSAGFTAAAADAPVTPAGVTQGSTEKKSKGRLIGSSRKRRIPADALVSGSAGGGFIPHIITVHAGEDILAKLLGFAQQFPHAICVLSGRGSISNVTLRRATSSGGTVSIEGRFEILSLSGSFILSESGGRRIRTGGLNVTLASPDGNILGGVVVGLLTAAAPVQLIVGTFMSENQKPVRNHISGALLVGSLPSCGAVSESLGSCEISFNHGVGGFKNPSNLMWR